MPEPSADDPTFGPASGSAPRGRGRRLLLYVGVVLAAAVVVLGGYVLLGNSGEQPSRLEIAERALGQALLQTDVMVMETGELPIFDPAQLIDYTSYRQDTILAGPGIVASSGQATPYVIQIPTARMQAKIVWLRLTDNTALGSPDNPFVVGWWVDGAAPGEVGNVLLDGHVDYTDITEEVGTGVSWFLADVTVGDPILIRNDAAQETYVYRVTEATAVAADDGDALRYLQNSSEPVLTFITCEGAFDHEAFEYPERRIVRAALEAIVPFEAAGTVGVAASPQG